MERHYRCIDEIKERMLKASIAAEDRLLAEVKRLTDAIIRLSEQREAAKPKLPDDIWPKNKYSMEDYEVPPEDGPLERETISTDSGMTTGEYVLKAELAAEIAKEMEVATRPPPVNDA